MCKVNIVFLRTLVPSLKVLERNTLSINYCNLIASSLRVNADGKKILTIALE